MSMTVKELKEMLRNIPDEAIVYIQADHGQTPEQAGYINLTHQEDGLDYYGEYINWNEEEYEDAETDGLDEVTAILIS